MGEKKVYSLTSVGTQTTDIVSAIPNNWYSVNGQLCVSEKMRRRDGRHVVCPGVAFRVIGREVQDLRAGCDLSKRQLEWCPNYSNLDLRENERKYCPKLKNAGFGKTPEFPEVDDVAMGMSLPCGIFFENAGRLTGENLAPIKQLIYSAMLKEYIGWVKFSSGYVLDAGRDRRFHNFNSCVFNSIFSSPEEVRVDIGLPESKLTLETHPKSGGDWKNLEWAIKVAEKLALKEEGVLS
jgi:hypothetical protein